MLRIDQLDPKVLNIEDNHMLIIDNAVGSTKVHITLSSRQSCQPSQRPHTGENKNRGRCKKNSPIRSNKDMINSHKCKLSHDRHCRCSRRSSGTPDSCCNASPDCEGNNCCQECIDRSGGRDTCDHCDNQGSKGLNYRQSKNLLSKYFNSQNIVPFLYILLRYKM
jgi:hypothetical protein